MRKAIFRSPLLVWPIFMLVALVAFPFSFWPELRNAIYYAYLDTFAPAITHAKFVTQKEED